MKKIIMATAILLILMIGSFVTVGTPNIQKNVNKNVEDSADNKLNIAYIEIDFKYPCEVDKAGIFIIFRDITVKGKVIKGKAFPPIGEDYDGKEVTLKVGFLIGKVRTYPRLGIQAVEGLAFNVEVYD
jgi:hypothetical protein